MTEKPVFSTRDIYLATTLVTMRFPMIGVDYQVEGDRNMPVGYFHFEDTSDIREAEGKYWKGSLAIEPRTFITNLRGLKAQVSSVYKNPQSNMNQIKTI